MGGAMETLDTDAARLVGGTGGARCASGMAGARHSSAGPEGPARTGAKPPPVLPHWTDPAAPWICVEHRADSGPRVRLDLRRLGFEVHWPREVHRVRGRDDVLRPFFPGYLFALPAASNASWGDVQERRQLGIFIVGLRERGCPAHPPPGFVLSMIERAGGALDGVIPAPEDALPVLRRGDAVTVRTGPLAGMRGIFEEQRGKRVEVLLEMLGVARQVRVAADNVEKSG